jgi:hypothetical protein
MSNGAYGSNCAKKSETFQGFSYFFSVLRIRIRIRIRIHRIHVFLGLQDPDPFIIMEK